MMFVPDVLGTTNAAAAAWSKLGGGVTQIFMMLRCTVQSHVWLWHCSDGPYRNRPHHCDGLEVLNPAEPVQLLS